MILQVNNLTKRYGKGKTALNNFSYQFSDGIYGLLGPNGAGKSTLMNIITQNLAPTSGEILADGKSIGEMGKSYRGLLGFMPQQQALYPDFTLTRFLYYMAGLKGISKKSAAPQIAELIRCVNLSEFAHSKLGGFSGGMKQRALLAQALIGSPKIVILDEPTAGLDPKERIRLRNLIAQTAFDKIVIIATHVVPDVEFIAKEVLFLKDGEIIDGGAPAKLCESVSKKVFEVIIEESELSRLQQNYRVANITHEGELLCVRVICDSAPKGEHRTVTPTLEDLYLYHFGEYCFPK
ncbi:MAG: ATP-binding cassette domain-containing protein [Firmicutes bacterium]|nr:ATP-binding cassette domain-containing protein [[Eubacterium] siraeum]MCM1489156.1 ATP-binding cassette domain-containing protein [Bacillota bacterium]